MANPRILALLLSCLFVAGAFACSSEEATPTPDIDATVEARVQATLQAIGNATPTPVSSPSPAAATPTPTTVVPTPSVGPTPEPTRPLPTPTPVPTPEPRWNLSTVDLVSLTCTDFHPGVQPIEPPNRWFSIETTLLNFSSTTTHLNMKVEILDRDGQVIDSGVHATGLQLPSPGPKSFDLQSNLVSAGPEGKCRVMFSESDFDTIEVGVVVVPIQELFLP